MVPSFDGGNDLVWIGGPGKGFGVFVGFGDEAIDGAHASFLHRQARLGAIKCLDLAFLIDRQHDGVGWRIDIETNDITQFTDEVGIARELELSSYARKLVTALSGGVFGYLDSVLERHSFDEFGKLI